MKNIIFKIIAEIVYRLYILYNGALKSNTLNEIINRSESDTTTWRLIFDTAFRREINAYVIAYDAWEMRHSDDIFSNNPVFSQYEEEFHTFAKKQEYKNSGMTNTSLYILYSMIRHNKPQIFIESGTRNGYSSVFIAEALQKNNNEAKMFCLSLFQGNEKDIAASALKTYEFVEIIEGYSEESIDKIHAQYKESTIGMLIDGPKARSKSWEILVAKVSEYFPNLQFLAVDSAQEHVPYWRTNSEEFTNRGINVERLKFVLAFQKMYKKIGFNLCIQSNQFSRKYQYLDDMVYEYRNKRWGKEIPYSPYNIDRVSDHIAYSYKLAVAYKKGIFS
jgi:hypothetical protein